jgi:hypothetical protein
MVMESNGEQPDFPKEVIYDSQEEEDQWPESQSTIHSATALTDTPKQPPLKVYGRTKVVLSYMSLNSSDLIKESQILLPQGVWVLLYRMPMPSRH